MINKTEVRAAIITLQTAGRASEAAAVWDLYDEYLEANLELILKAGDSEEVQGIESLLFKPQPIPQPRLSPMFPTSDEALCQIAGGVQRCTSYYLSQENEEIVQCQGFVSHTHAHSFDTIDQGDGEGYCWTDEQEFVFGEGLPSRYLTPEEEPATPQAEPTHEPTHETTTPPVATCARCINGWSCDIHPLHEPLHETAPATTPAFAAFLPTQPSA